MSWIAVGVTAVGVGADIYGGIQSQNDAGKVNPDQPQFQNPEQPYLSGWASMLNNLVTNPSSVSSLPGYQFQMDQGTQAIQGSSAARGMLNSGNTLSALDKYGQGLASSFYQQQFNNLSGIASGNPQWGQLQLNASEQHNQLQQQSGNQFGGALSGFGSLLGGLF
jgi:hypothetical protein